MVRNSRWFPDETPRWLEEGEFQADALVDLETDDNKLSVWLIDEDSSNLPRVIAAMAAHRKSACPFDYALFRDRLVAEIGTRIEKSLGDSEDDEANRLWHRDLVELSASKVMALAKVIFDSNGTNRCWRKDVVQLIVESVALKQIELDKLQPSLKSTIEKKIPAAGSND